MNPRILFGGIALVLVSITFGYWLAPDAPPVSKTTYRAPQPPPVVTCSYPQVKDENGKCADPKEGRTEVLDSGFVRVINTDQKLVVYETDYGFMKALVPYCWQSTTLPLWVGMRVTQMNYRWIADSQCYAIDYIGHAPQGDLKVVSPKVSASGVTQQ